jgi:hypothetical protein
MKYRDRNRKYRFTIRIQYLLAVGYGVALEPSCLKFLLSFRKRPRLKMKRHRLLDFDGATERQGLILREADV